MNMEICCGCSSRVLKLQSELRSWKAKLADEKREKRMILKWILAVIGYDVRVDLDKETYGVRVEATENKEAASKAFVKLGIGGTDDNVGTLIMELKLEKNEFLESFEDPYEGAEFPILEINSMSTTQHPIVNTGISSSYSQFSQPQIHSSYSIGAPVEVACNSIGMNTGSENEQEVLYITGNLEDGATLEGPNGQSYIIVRGNETDEIPMQVDYSSVDSDEVIGDGNMYYRVATPSSTNDTTNAINYLPITHTEKLSHTHYSHPTVITSTQNLLAPLADHDHDTKITGVSTTLKSHSKNKNSIQKHIGIKNNLVSQAKTQTSKNTSKISSTVGHIASREISSGSVSKIKPKKSGTNTEKAKIETSNSPKRKDVFEFGLTLREKAEIYVLQKAKEAIEKVPHGFTCNVCGKGSYTYSNEEAVMAHTKSHYESKPYKCDFCDELFSIQKKLLTHRKTVHPKPKGNINHVTTSRVAHPSLQNPNEPKSSTVVVSGSNSTSPSFPTRTIVLQAPLDKKDLNGPLSISKEVWEAILRSNSSTVMLSSDAQHPNKSISKPSATKVPTIVIASNSSGNKTNKKARNVNLNFSSARSDKKSAVKTKS